METNYHMLIARININVENQSNKCLIKIIFSNFIRIPIFQDQLRKIGSYIRNKYTRHDTKNNLIRKLLETIIIPRLIYSIENSWAY